MDERIRLAVAEAEDAFWCTLAKHFPETKTGDYPPDLAFKFSEQMRFAARLWVEMNVR